MTRLHKLLNARTDRAVFEYKMLEPGDRVLVSVSGGSDSMALLDILRLRIRVYGLDVQLFAVYIDLGFEPDPKNRCEQMGTFFRRNQITGRIIETNIGLYSQSDENRENPCFLCTRMRRKRMFESADELGCNKIALGHHKDDMIETLFINMIWGRELSTMSPNLPVFSGRFHLIRPLMYIEEPLLKKYCLERDLFTFKNPCPTAGNSKRQYVKELLEKIESEQKGAKENIFHAMKNVKSQYLL